MWTADISKAVLLTEFVMLYRTTSAWFRDVLQTEGVIQGVILLCHVRNISNNWLVVTSVWTTVFTNAPADISLVWWHWLKKTDFIISTDSTKNFCWNAEIWVATQYVCCGSWKICFNRKLAVTKTSFIIYFPDLWYSSCWTLWLYGNCRVTFSSWNIIIYRKKPGCAGPKICLYHFK